MFYGYLKALFTLKPCTWAWINKLYLYLMQGPRARAPAGSTYKPESMVENRQWCHFFSFGRNMIFVLVNISRKKDINEIKAEREEKFWVEKNKALPQLGWSHKFR